MRAPVKGGRGGMITGDNETSVREFVQKVADQKGISFKQAIRLLIDIAEEIAQGGKKNDAD